MTVTTTERGTWAVTGEMFGQAVTVFEHADIFECLAFVAEQA